jgi:hypothetical protein
MSDRRSPSDRGEGVEVVGEDSLEAEAVVGRHPEVRYLDIHESDELDEPQLVSWIDAASRLPGERM